MHATRHPIRVAYIIQNLNYGGMERVLHDLARQLTKRGFEIHIVVLEYLGRFAEGLEDVVTFHQLPAMGRLSLFHPVQLTDLLRRIEPDIVHSHSGVWLKAARAARLAGVPVTVHTEHGRPDPIPVTDRLIDNQASRWTDVVIAVSEPLAGVLRRQVMHEPWRVRVVVNGVDVEQFRRTSDQAGLREELGIPSDAFVIGSIGRLEPVKNYGLALRAFARLRERPEGGPRTMLVFVGDGSERAILEAFAAERIHDDRVRFLGWRADADRFYGIFDLFTLTSRSEGTSISLLEAMSSGVCPVVTDVGGNRAVLGAELASLLVPDNDEIALATAWRHHIEDSALRETMGNRSRLRVEQAFSLERMIEQHVDLYHELLQDSPSRHSGKRETRRSEP